MAKPFTPRFDFGRGFARISKNLRSYLVLLNDLFDEVSGHDHATAAEGAPIPSGGLAALSVDTAELAADAVDSTKIEDNAVDSEHYVDGSVDDIHLASLLLKEPGRQAMGLIDFNAVGDAASTVTIGAVTYLESDTPTVTNGEWTNGATATTSATSLAAAINGDTRATLVYAAVAVGTSVWVFALAVGTAGNVAITASGTDPDVTEDLIGGAAAAVKQVVNFQHVVTAEEAVQVQVLIPLPFDAAFFEWHVYDTNGGILAVEVTDRGSVVNAAAGIPAYFQVITNGATHISAGDVIRVTCIE